MSTVPLPVTTGGHSLSKYTTQPLATFNSCCNQKHGLHALLAAYAHFTKGPPVYLRFRFRGRVRFRSRPPTILFHPLAWPRPRVPIGSVKRHCSISTGHLVGMVMHVLYTVL